MNIEEAKRRIEVLNTLISSSENEMRKLELVFKQDYSSLYKHDQLWLKNEPHKKERDALINLIKDSRNLILSSLTNG